MTETTKTTIQLVTAAAALVGALTGLWNTFQFAQLAGRVQTLETGHNAHVNAAGLHGR